MTWTMVVHSKDILLLYYPIQKDALSKLAMTWTINVFSCCLIYYRVLTYMYAANKIWENIFLDNYLQWWMLHPNFSYNTNEILFLFIAHYRRNLKPNLCQSWKKCTFITPTIISVYEWIWIWVLRIDLEL